MLRACHANCILFSGQGISWRRFVSLRLTFSSSRRVNVRQEKELSLSVVICSVIYHLVEFWKSTVACKGFCYILTPKLRVSAVLGGRMKGVLQRDSFFCVGERVLFTIQSVGEFWWKIGVKNKGQFAAVLPHRAPCLGLLVLHCPVCSMTES